MEPVVAYTPLSVASVVKTSSPTAAELSSCIDTLEEEDLQTVCHAAFNTNEVLFRP